MDGIYLGYGFLSENVGFVKVVMEVGIIFIGLGFLVIEVMGSKLVVKEVVKVYGIFMVFGVDEVIEDIFKVKVVVVEIGYLIFIKVLVGGGGKGMWIVE